MDQRTDHCGFQHFHPGDFIPIPPGQKIFLSLKDKAPGENEEMGGYLMGWMFHVMDGEHKGHPTIINTDGTLEVLHDLHGLNARICMEG